MQQTNNASANGTTHLLFILVLLLFGPLLTFFGRILLFVARLHILDLTCRTRALMRTRPQ